MRTYTVSDNTISEEFESETPQDAAKEYFSSYTWGDGEREQPYYVRDETGTVVLESTWHADDSDE